MEALRLLWAVTPHGGGGNQDDSSERLRLLSGADSLAGTAYEREAIDWPIRGSRCAARPQPGGNRPFSERSSP
ncbi:hypothetical protein [Arthrobacter sp. TMN-37]